MSRGYSLSGGFEMELPDVMAWVKWLIDSLGLGPFILAFMVVIVVGGFMRAFFHRGG
jgi:type II secretory pathway component PulF